MPSNSDSLFEKAIDHLEAAKRLLKTAGIPERLHDLALLIELNDVEGEEKKGTIIWEDFFSGSVCGTSVRMTAFRARSGGCQVSFFIGIPANGFGFWRRLRQAWCWLSGGKEEVEICLSGDEVTRFKMLLRKLP